MALTTKTVNGETWYLNSGTRISQAEYEALQAGQEFSVRKRFVVSLDGTLTEATEEDTDGN